jgi:hypothetical protein
MLSKAHLIFTTVAVSAVCDAYLMRKLKRANHHLNETNIKLANMVIDAETRVTYLCHMIDEHDVEFTEFDLIALINPIA